MLAQVGVDQSLGSCREERSLIKVWSIQLTSFYESMGINNSAKHLWNKEWECGRSDPYYYTVITMGENCKGYYRYEITEIYLVPKREWEFIQLPFLRAFPIEKL